MIQFYSPFLESTLTLGPEEAHHCVKVLRRKTGDIIYVTDGKGKRFECRLVQADTKHLQLEIINETFIPLNWKNNIVLAVAPTKNSDRMSWLVEKATEIGVNKIIFLNCRNSERKNLNVERLRRNAISAMNQSLKTHLPEIGEIVGLKTICDYPGEKYFGYCDSEIERKEFIKDYKGGDVTILIGPEGDFDRDEVDLLISAGYMPVTFGDERLRTETAALYGVTATHIINQLNKKT